MELMIGAVRFIWNWLVVIRDWFYMKPFCYGSSADHMGKRYTFVGVNLPRGWKFLHIYYTRDGNNVNLRLFRTRAHR